MSNPHFAVPNDLSVGMFSRPTRVQNVVLLRLIATDQREVV